METGAEKAKKLKKLFYLLDKTVPFLRNLLEEEEYELNVESQICGMPGLLALSVFRADDLIGCLMRSFPHDL